MNAKEISYITRIKRYVLFDIGGTEYDELHIVKGKFVRIIKVDSADKSTVSFTLEDDSNNVHISVIKKSSAMYKKYYKKPSEGKPFVLIYTNGVAPVIHTHFMIEDIDNIYDLCAQAVEDLNEVRIKSDTALSVNNESLSKLPNELRSHAEQQLSFAKTFDVARRGSSQLRFDSYEDVFNYYRSIKTTLPPTTQMYLNACFASKGVIANKQRVEKILSFNSGYTPETLEPSTFRLALDKFVTGNNSVKRAVIDSIAVSARSKRKGMKLLFVGPSGCGKRTLIRGIARIRHAKPFVTIPFHSFTSLTDAAGCLSTFQDSMPGYIGKQLLNINTCDATFMFEGIDRANNEENKNGTPYQCLEHILTDSLYYDCHYEIDFSLDSAWLFATAENEDVIDKKILDGFDKIIHIKAYTDDEKLEIAKKHLIPELIGSYNETALFTDSALRYVISTFCYDDGVNILKKVLETIYNKALEEKLDIETQGYSNDRLDEILDKNSMFDLDEAVIKSHQKDFDPASSAAIDKILFNASKKDETGVSDVAKSQIKYLAGFLRPAKSPVFEYKRFMDELNKTHSGMNEIKLALARTFAKHYRTGKGNNVLFVSGPGQGKTTVVRAAAKVYGIPFVKVSCNGVNDSCIFKGTTSATRGGKPGRIISSLSEVGNNAVIMLDEIDKLNTSGNGCSVVSSILDALDEKLYTDYYFDGITFDLSKVIFVATANYIENIPAELLNRFEVVEMAPYTVEQKRDILVNHILAKVYEENCTDGIIFDDEAVDLLIRYSGDEPGVRTIETNTRRVVETVLLTEETYIVTGEDIKSIIHSHNNVNRKMGF